MRVRRLVGVALIVGLFVMGTGGPASAVPVTPIGAVMDGSQEVPGPGSQNGWGVFLAKVYPNQGRICYTFWVRHVAKQGRTAHIHAGAFGVAGPIVITLQTPHKNLVLNRCQTGISSALLQDIVDNPTDYYVNLHTPRFPGGAIRGQIFDLI